MSGSLNPYPTWLLGQVRHFNPQTHTYTVISESRMFEGIQRLLDSPGDTHGLEKGTLVALHCDLGEWVIAGVLNKASSGRFEISPVKVTEYTKGGADDPVADASPVGDARAHGAPTDIGPGDWARHNPDGAAVALLKGGAAVIKGSPLAQVRTHGESDSVEIISHAFRHITGMGVAEVKHEGDLTSYTWRGGSNFSDQAGPSNERWTIRLDVGAGATGDLVSLAVTTPDGRVLSRIAMTADGRLELRGTTLSTTSSSPATAPHVTVGDQDNQISGGRKTLVKGSSTETIRGDRTEKVSKASDTTIGGTEKKQVNGDQIEGVAGKERKRVGGGVQPVPGDMAGVINYANGGVEVALGSPMAGGVPALQNAQWVSYGGGFSFVAGPAPGPNGGFKVISPLPESVQLGADGMAVYNPVTGAHKIVAIPALYSVMLFEPWLAMMSQILTWMDMHTHATDKSPASAGLIGPVTPLVQPLMAAVRSARVKVGL